MDQGESSGRNFSHKHSQPLSILMNERPIILVANTTPTQHDTILIRAYISSIACGIVQKSA